MLNILETVIIKKNVLISVQKTLYLKILYLYRCHFEIYKRENLIKH